MRKKDYHASRTVLNNLDLSDIRDLPPNIVSFSPNPPSRSKQLSKQKRRQKYPTDQNNEVIEFNSAKDGMLRLRNKVSIIPRNTRQEELLEHLIDPSVSIVFATGPAGTGKTYIATLAAIKEFKEGNIDRIIITRPAVSVDEQHGFLPGTLEEKMAPWVMPMMDIFHEYFTTDQIEFMIKEKKIEIAPLAYMRGRSFRNVYIIADECQLTTPAQMKMLLTRIGEGCKLVITGDLDQADRGASNGLKDFIARFSGYYSSRIKSVLFMNKDIQRHPVIEEILEMYKD